jgi:hypothetical protein
MSLTPVVGHEVRKRTVGPLSTDAKTPGKQPGASANSATPHEWLPLAGSNRGQGD